MLWSLICLVAVTLPLAVVGAAFVYVVYNLGRPWKGPEQ